MKRPHLIGAEAPMRRLRVLRWDEEPSGKSKALDRLFSHAHDLHSIGKHMPPKYHERALELIRRDRIYVFEQNKQRWPDGLYYMLDRGYQHWDERARFGFALDELRDLGVLRWADGRAIRSGFELDCLPMASDCFQYYPRRWLREYAALVGRVATFLETRMEGPA